MKRTVVARVMIGLVVALAAAAAHAQCGGGGGGGCGGVVMSKPDNKTGVVIQVVNPQGELSYSFCQDAKAARARKGEIAKAYAQALEAWRQARDAFAKEKKGLLFPELMPVEPVVKTIAQNLAAEADGKKKIAAADDCAWAVVLIESAGVSEYKAVPQLALPYCREVARIKYAQRYNAWLAAGADQANEPAKPKVRELADKLSQAAAETKAGAASQKAAVTATDASTPKKQATN